MPFKSIKLLNRAIIHIGFGYLKHPNQFNGGLINASVLCNRLFMTV